jgi:putative transposase
MCKGVEHRSHKELNNRVEHAHQPTRRKVPHSIQITQDVIALMGETRTLFAVAVGRYTNSAHKRRIHFQKAKKTWQNAASDILCI